MINSHIARHICGFGYGLSVKFRWLRLSYTIFAIGLAASALVFVLAMGHLLPWRHRPAGLAGRVRTMASTAIFRA
jgi:hypothetical protein